MTTNMNVTTDAQGNKIVAPVFNGGTGSVGGFTDIRK